MVVSGETLYHIGLRRSEGAAYCLLTGDPGRAETVAQYLEDPRFVAQNREYVTWEGRLEEERVLVVSHGIGGPSTAICVEELVQCGAQVLIRIGTCGGMHLEVRGGDLVVASAAIRMEGLSREYLPVEFPAVADFEVTAALAQAGKSAGIPCHVGVVQCKDSFYGQHDPKRMPVSQELLYKWEAWKRLGVLASEMESAALFCCAAALGVRCGSCFHVIWNQEREAAGLDQEESHDLSAALEVGIEAVRLLIEADRAAKG